MPRLSAHLAPFEICHRIPGRMRLRIPALQENAALGARMAGALRALDGVQAMRINPACASLVLYHRPAHRLTPDILAQALQPLLPSTVSPPGLHPGLRPAKPPTRSAQRSLQRPSPPSAPPAPTPCILCRMKLNATRWILADVWRCWRQHFTQRMRAVLVTAFMPLRS
ncbi:HMA2 domain-containing protein [Thiocystis violascens]|uniref:Cation transport ATPase n=1 Tax=Thiocystis violascens (strain ATCC 17096 / DSM 198 / 6111) TaxID=765911 RepID=I3YG68_THIV6|nr:hypothetical protein [Thiocystis violascens]AFL75986.1 hypothetical protein Thivi_4168 [Thiocystis violascens DSM 198]